VDGITECLHNKAVAYQQQVINKAMGDVARFQAVLDSYEGKNNNSAEAIKQNIKNVTKQRLYFDAMQKALSKSTNVIMDKSSNNMMYLPLDKIIKKESVDSEEANKPASNQAEEGQQSDLTYCENTVQSQFRRNISVDSKDSGSDAPVQTVQNNQGRGGYGS